MPHGEYAECPQCGVTAHGKDEIEEIFGYRYGGTMPQSWCRECRSKGKGSILGAIFGGKNSSDDSDEDE